MYLLAVGSKFPLVVFYKKKITILLVFFSKAQVTPCNISYLPVKDPPKSVQPVSDKYSIIYIYFFKEKNSI